MSAPTTVVARDGTRLAVHVRGEGPPLLCLPGGPGRASAYLEDLGGLTATRTLHLLDSRGSGASELPADRGSLQFPRLADDVEDVRAGFGWDRVDVLGHSAGCPVALTFAGRYSARVRSLVLVTPSGRPYGIEASDVEAIRAGRSGEPWFADAAAAAELAATAPPRLRAGLDRAMRPFWYSGWDDRRQAHAASADTQVSLRAAAGYPPGDGYDAAAALAALGEVDVPVLVLAGALDGLTGVAAARAVADALPRAETTVLAGAGHFPWVDAGAAFAATVADFLAS